MSGLGAVTYDLVLVDHPGEEQVLHAFAHPWPEPAAAVCGDLLEIGDGTQQVAIADRLHPGPASCPGCLLITTHPGGGAAVTDGALVHELARPLSPVRGAVELSCGLWKPVFRLAEAPEPGTPGRPTECPECADGSRRSLIPWDPRESR